VGWVGENSAAGWAGEKGAKVSVTRLTQRSSMPKEEERLAGSEEAFTGAMPSPMD